MQLKDEADVAADFDEGGGVHPFQVAAKDVYTAFLSRPQSADQRHDQNDQPRHQKVTALVRFVKPHAALYRHRSVHGRQSLGGALSRPLADRALRVALDDPRVIGVDTVHQHLHFGTAKA